MMTRDAKSHWGTLVSLLVASAAGSGCAVDTTDHPTSADSGNENQLAETVRATPSRDLAADTRFFVRPPDADATKQVVDLVKHRHLVDAARVTAMLATPQAVWFTGGTPADVKSSVKKTMAAGALTHRTPVLVAYNIPFRDCAQYSAGGATDTAAYEAWIDGFASGIGQGQAVVILEPDSLGIIPYNTTLFGAQEWCQPTVTDSNGNTVPAPGATSDERYAQLKYAVSSILAKAPGASVYLDGTHSAWLGVSEAAYRLYKAGFTDGVQQVQGFFLNVSNYQPTDQSVQFGTWVSMCLAAGTPGVGPDWMQNTDTGIPHFDWCPGQYDPATNYTTVNYTPDFEASVTSGIQGLMGGASAQTKFVIDTSRNGVGPWTPPADASYPDPQTWCNPPARGLGARPTASTGNSLAAAYLWVKTPGESDGACNRGITGSTTDPEWGGSQDPDAGAWFPAQALQLAQLAAPPLL
ncbi:MAG TPA: glycoside hydrolase family 6 protein [Polyangiaceae bacterium]|nr:glycoside hydrolase family 6 protein [Polyangiaceae bacterium]